jgi:hypothetical protein
VVKHYLINGLLTSNSNEEIAFLLVELRGYLLMSNKCKYVTSVNLVKLAPMADVSQIIK